MTCRTVPCPTRSERWASLKTGPNSQPCSHKGQMLPSPRTPPPMAVLSPNLHGDPTVLEAATQLSPPGSDVPSSQALSDTPASPTSHSCPSLSPSLPTELWTRGLRNEEGNAFPVRWTAGRQRGPEQEGPIRSREDPGSGKTGRQKGPKRALPQGHCSGAAVLGEAGDGGVDKDREQPSRARPRAYHQLDGRGRRGGAFIQMASDKTPQASQVTRGPG